MRININRSHLEYLLIDLIRAGCAMQRACDMLGISYHQGRYIIEKRQTSVRKLRRYRRLRSVTNEVLDNAHRLLASGATADEVAMLTGLTVNQICELDRFGYWVEGLEDALM